MAYGLLDAFRKDAGSLLEEQGRRGTSGKGHCANRCRLCLPQLLVGLHTLAFAFIKRGPNFLPPLFLALPDRRENHFHRK